MLPLVVTQLLGQGLGLLANAAMNKGGDWLKEKTGVDLSAATMSPEDVVKLRQFELEHEAELLRIARDSENDFLKDVQSARDMQSAALSSDDKFSKRFIYLFALFLSMCAVGYIVAITFTDIPKENVRFADTILGFLLGTMLSQILSFFFGSSRQSQVKDEALRSAIQKIKKE